MRQHDPLMSPLVWDLAHIGQQEELWLLRAVDAAGGMLPANIDSSTTPSNIRGRAAELPLLPPADAGSLRRGARRVLDVLERTDEALFDFAMVVQHEQQHDETMLATLQLRSGPPLLDRRPRCRPAARCPAAC